MCFLCQEPASVILQNISTRLSFVPSLPSSCPSSMFLFHTESIFFFFRTNKAWEWKCWSSKWHDDLAVQKCTLFWPLKAPALVGFGRIWIRGTGCQTRSDEFTYINYINSPCFTGDVTQLRINNKKEIGFTDVCFHTDCDSIWRRLNSIYMSPTQVIDVNPVYFERSRPQGCFEVHSCLSQFE